MKRFFALAALGLALIACNTLPQPQSKAIGVLELDLNGAGVSSAKFQRGLSPQALTLREADVVFGTGTTQVVSATSLAHDYLVATFPISHARTSSTSFKNLTLYALAKSGNIGNTAISSIQNFGGVTNALEQARLAKHLVPASAVSLNAGNLIIETSSADFQAFTFPEIDAVKAAAQGILGVNDSLLNYGFSARCINRCLGASREIPLNGEGSISIAVRVPKASTATTYRFTMTFVVLDESVSRITRSLIPPETLAQAENRAEKVSATQMMQVGLHQAQTSSSLGNNFVNDVHTSSHQDSIRALDKGRISAGGEHTCGLTPNGDAFCWGTDGSGQLGNGTPSNSFFAPTPIDLSNFAEETIPDLSNSISSGGVHTCALSKTGSGYCWGNNVFGQLGIGSSDSRSHPTRILLFSFLSSISAGGFHTCAVTRAGVGYCWGNNDFGQLGKNIVEITPVDPPNGESALTFLSIVAGGTHSCGLTIAGKAYCWGNAQYGRLGNNASTGSSSTPVPVAAPTGGSSLTFSSLSAGSDHTCGITSTGAAYCWGYNFYGQLGNGNSGTDANSAVPVLVSAPSGITWSSISTGGNHTCAVATTGQAYCWGNDSVGQLGNSSTLNDDSAKPVEVAAPLGGNALTFSSIAAGAAHTCALTTTGTAHCWGIDGAGQLGNGSGGVSSSGLPVAVVSNSFKF
jgi:alpha-tubulin suppressor-like RCC1 family protein